MDFKAFLMLKLNLDERTAEPPSELSAFIDS